MRSGAENRLAAGQPHATHRYSYTFSGLSGFPSHTIIQLEDCAKALSVAPPKQR